MNSRIPTLDDLSQVVDPTSPVLFPDGATVVYAAVRHPENAPAVSELRVVDNRARTQFLTSGAFDAQPSVSSDAELLAFTRKGENDKNLFVVPTGGGTARQLTYGLDIVEGAEFSPCGQWLAFTALVDEVSGDLQPPVVVRGEPSHKADGLGWLGTARTEVFVVSVVGGEPLQLTRCGPCFSPAWSPDGSQLAFHQTVYDMGNEPIVQRVGLVEVNSPGASAHFPFEGTGVTGPLVWSPDGSSVIALGNLTPRIALTRLLRLDVKTGKAEVLTAELDRNVMAGGSPAYPGGAPSFGEAGRLYFCIRDGGQTVICSLEFGSGALTRHPFSENTVVTAMSIQGNLYR